MAEEKVDEREEAIAEHKSEQPAPEKEGLREVSEPAKKAKQVLIKEARKEAKEERQILFLNEVRQAREGSRKRRFNQTWGLIINLKNMDLKKPENRFSADFTLPEGRGKELKVAVFADSVAAEAKGCADLVLRKDDVVDLSKNKKRLKRLADDYDWFLGEATLMPLIGKGLGQVLGVRGKMPRPVPPKAKIEPFVLGAKNKVVVSLKNSPVIHVVVGSEKMTDEQIARNASAVFNFVKERLPKGPANIRSAHIKLTMGRPVRLNI